MQPPWLVENSHHVGNKVKAFTNLDGLQILRLERGNVRAVFHINLKADVDLEEGLI